MQLIRVFFRTVLCAALPLCLLCGSLSVAAYTGAASKDKTAGTNLRVMSYNVLVDNDESLGGWSWGQALGNRGDKASACINYYRPDVIGLQECNYKWHVSLRQNLPDYDFVNPDVPEVQALEKSDSLGKKDWMCTTLMYNTKTLTLLANELVGYTVNYWGCIQRMRYVSMALFEIKATGEKFSFISTHLDAEKDAKGQANRLTQAGELAECINRYKATYGCPVIATGDYNSGFADAPIQAVVSKAGMTASANNRGGIDYILYSAGIESKYFTTISDADVSGASDHAPVIADLAVSNYAFPTTKATTTTTTQYTPPYITTASTTRQNIVVNKNTTTESVGADTTTVGGSDVTTTMAPDTDATTDAAQDAHTTTAQKADNDTSGKDTMAETPPSILTTLPVWVLAVGGFVATALLGGLVLLIVMLATKK